MRKIGIMGGTFNPIHMGHMMIAECAREALRLDEVIFIPTGNSYMKNNVLSASDRVRMTELSIADNPFFSLSTIETDREGNSYSYETILLLKEQFPDTDFYFIVGADSLLYMDQWKNPDVIFDNVRIVVASRNSNSMDEIKRKIQILEDKFKAEIIILPVRNIDISSSNIRYLVNTNQSIRYLVHSKVMDYILENRLYKDEV